MKAAVKDRPEPGIWVKELPKPALEQNDVLVRVKRASICGSDIGLYEYTEAYRGFANLPIIPGHEFAGEVADLGVSVTDFKVGDRVVAESLLSCGTCKYCRESQPNLCVNFKVLGIHINGGFSEYAVVPANHLHRLRDELEFSEAALIEPLAVNCHAIHDVAKLDSSDFVVVIGPGPIGLLAAQVARSSGCRNVFVSGIEVDERRLAIARTLGFKTINSGKGDALPIVLEQTANIGADVVVVAAGSAQALAQACEIVRKGGKILNIGIFAKPVEVPVTKLVRGEISLLGTFASVWKDYEEAMRLVATRTVDLRSLITHEFQIDDAVKAFETAKAREGCKVQLYM